MRKSVTTLKDVARASGFSVMTVSNILNGKKLNQASPSSREIIVAAAKRLNYRPNLNARRLVTRQTDRVGLMIDRHAPGFCHDVMMELEALVVERGRRLHVAFVRHDLDSLRACVADFRSSGIDSVICLAHAYPEFGERVPALLEEFDHVVFLERPLAPTRFPVVAADHYRNFHDATAELLRRGFRRVFSLRSNYLDIAFAEALRGMRDAYREAGVRFEDRFWWRCDTEWWRDEATANRELARLLPEEPEALILGNDESMFWSLRTLRKRGLDAPKDLSLFSADLWRFGLAATPSFSGFDYDAPRLARHIVRRWDESFDKKPEGWTAPVDLVPARVVWGESCGRDGAC